MTQKEKLMELLEEEKAMPRYLTDDERRERLANHLLENGVRVLRVETGSTFFCIIENEIRKATVDYVERPVMWRIYDNTGEAFFLTREEAEQALKERGGGDA